MPIYEYECKDGHRTEKIFPITKIREVTICMAILENDICRNCADLVPSICAMHPDNMWSGVNTQQGYFTSKEQHLSYLRNNNLERVERGMTEEVKKKAKNRLPEQMKKNEAKLDKFLQKELASM